MAPPRSSHPVISVVIPVCNEEENLTLLHRRLEPVLRGLGREYEVIYVDDGSADGSLVLLMNLQDRYPGTVRVVELYRNFGQFAAVLAGLEIARGAIVITLDADLQNPPEEIPRLVAKIDEGFDVVNGWRRGRHDNLFRRLGSRVANRISCRITGVKLNDIGCMLRAYRHEIVQQILACKDRSIYIPTLANAFARRPAEIEVAHAGRGAGVSKYSVTRLISLQYDLMTSFSNLPLRLLSLFGLVIALPAMGFGSIAIARWTMGGPGQSADHALLALLFVLVGLLFSALGLVGEYVGRIFDDVRGRPRFVVRSIREGRGHATQEPVLPLLSDRLGPPPLDPL
jgi:undecaprenyl-phosphate 4-deoxy-4-formamido-L-arabinose transferase